jgi:hypothetical protein
MHRLEHALMVARDLKRCKQDYLVLNGCQPDIVEGLAYLVEAIGLMRKAYGCFERVPDCAAQGLTTEAIQHCDLQRTGVR